MTATHSCDLSPFLPTILTLESYNLCEYVRYHLALALLFGPTAAVLFCAAAAIHARNRAQAHLIKRCLKWALGSMMLAFGLEFVLLAVYVVCFVFLLFSVARFFLVGQTEAVVVAPLGGGEIRTVPNAACSICLGTAGGPMHTTACGHTFHKACILKWRGGTCPLCRQPI